MDETALFFMAYGAARFVGVDHDEGMRIAMLAVAEAEQEVEAGFVVIAV